MSSSGHWPLANHLQCSKPGWIMPSLWYTLMHTSTDKLFNLLLMTSSEKCPQGRVYFYKSENSGYLIIGWTRLSQSSCEFTFCPQLPLPTGGFQLSTTSQLFLLILLLPLLLLLPQHILLPSSTYFLQQLVLLPLPPALLPNKAQNYPGFTTVTHSSLPGGCKSFDDASHACFSFNSLSITTTSAYLIGNA